MAFTFCRVCTSLVLFELVSSKLYLPNSLLPFFVRACELVNPLFAYPSRILILIFGFLANTSPIISRTFRFSIDVLMFHWLFENVIPNFYLRRTHKPNAKAGAFIIYTNIYTNFAVKHRCVESNDCECTRHGQVHSLLADQKEICI